MTDEPKIIVDEDWKSQVQAEKEALAGSGPEQQPTAQPTATPQPAAAAQEAAGTQGGTQPSAAAPHQELPPPTLALLCTSLATQALFALGRFADPQSGKAEVRLDEARHLIDTLQMLEEKTQGNRTAEESALLTRLLYDLRMDFVAVRDAKGGG